MKALSRVYRATDAHWVGDGFPVRTVFSYNTHGADISPFLLLDYAGPAEFPPASRPRGVGKHPHRGFETVTIVYQGEVEHRDNAGNRGRIGPGDVQWMTAAKGIVHEEMHGRAFAATGGTFGATNGTDCSIVPGRCRLAPRAGQLPRVNPHGAREPRIARGR